MRIKNRNLGEIEVDPESSLHIPEGILGFEDHERFLLVRLPEYEPFLWLVAETDPELAFAVADPAHFLDEPYLITMTEADTERLDLHDGDPLEVYVIASTEGERPRVTGNLKGPVVVNARNRVAKQLLVYSTKLSVRQPMRIVVGNGMAAHWHPTTVRIAGKRVA